MNYYAQYLKEKPEIIQEDYAIPNHDEIDKIQRKINKLNEQVAAARQELADKKEEIISSKYKMTPYKKYVYYSRTDTYYDWDTCTPVTKAEIDEHGKRNDDYILVKMTNTTDNVTFAMGYDLPKGVIVAANYNIRIESAKSKLHHTFQNQTAICIADKENYYYHRDFESTRNSTIEFINQFFDVDYKGNLSQSDLVKAYKDNASFEIILRQADENVKDALLEMKFDEAMPMHKIFGLTRPTYQLLQQEELLPSLLRLIKSGVTLPDSENELIEILQMSKDAKEDLEFYKISANGERGYYRWDRNKEGDFGGPYDNNDMTASIAYVIFSQYYSNPELKENYTLKKFTKYIIDQSINQGYTSIKTYIEELRDYIHMCEVEKIKPTLESSQLKQTHDVTARNHKIFLDEEQEKAFTGQYVYYKDEKINDEYHMIVPKSSNDLKIEGDTLNHCVASYIKRVMDGECLIFFLRKDPKESLVTIEVRNGKVAQVHGIHNRDASDKEAEAIAKWAHTHKIRY